MSLKTLIHTRPGRWLQIRLRKMHHFAGLLRKVARLTLRPHFSTDERLFRLFYCLERTKKLPGAIAECGVGSGYSMVYILTYLKDKDDKRAYHGFDTFEGFPFIDAEDLENLPEHRKSISVVGHYKDFHLQHIRKLQRKLAPGIAAHFHQGRFDETIPPLPQGLRFSFVYLDCDLYNSYKSCLAAIYDRVLPDGIVLFDEYEHTVEWPGARKAIDEFFANRPEKPEPLPFGTSWYVRKPKGADAAAAAA